MERMRARVWCVLIFGACSTQHEKEGRRVPQEPNELRRESLAYREKKQKSGGVFPLDDSK